MVECGTSRPPGEGKGVNLANITKKTSSHLTSVGVGGNVFGTCNHRESILITEKEKKGFMKRNQ